MKKPSHARVILSHSSFAHVVAIAAALVACGGMVSGSSPDASPPGCPSNSDIQTQTAVGRACSSDGLYCPEQGCDPCTQYCHAVQCTNGAWQTAVNTGICTVDAGMCVTIDLTSFDTSCNVDSDCMGVATGTFCSGQPWCMCPGEAINVDGQSQYQADMQAVQSLGPNPHGCACPYLGSPRCIKNVCTVCGGPTACPDGG